MRWTPPWAATGRCGPRLPGPTPPQWTASAPWGAPGLTHRLARAVSRQGSLPVTLSLIDLVAFVDTTTMVACSHLMLFKQSNAQRRGSGGAVISNLCSPDCWQWCRGTMGQTRHLLHVEGWKRWSWAQGAHVARKRWSRAQRAHVASRTAPGLSSACVNNAVWRAGAAVPLGQVRGAEQ